MEPVTVTMFKASDGKLFHSEIQCREHESSLANIASIMRPLGDRPSLDADQFVQHDKDACLSIKRQLIEIAKTLYSPHDYPVFQNDADEIHPCGMAGRIITDDVSPLASAWNRLMCIDWKNFREFNQPFFALESEKAA